MDREKNERTANAFKWSIYTMLGVPFVMLGGLISLVVVNVRARERQRDVPPAQDPPEPSKPPDRKEPS